MDHYRSYMDRIGLRPEEHRALMDRLKENTAPERRRTARRLLPAACMALCCLAALGVWRMWKLPVPDVPPEEEQVRSPTARWSPLPVRRGRSMSSPFP